MSHFVVAAGRRIDTDNAGVSITSRASTAAEALVGDIETAYDATRDAWLAYRANENQTTKQAYRDAHDALSDLWFDYSVNINETLLDWLEANLP